MKEEYVLRGIIAYKQPRNIRNILKNDIGHFTAISFQNNQWLEYDDCKTQPKKLPKNYTANIQVIIYSI